MPTDGNVFNENVDYLIKAREEVLELDRTKAKSEDLRNLDKKILKQIAQEEKSIADEISNTLKKRKSDIANTYDKQIDSNRNKIKDIKSKRERVKTKKVSERVDLETAEIKEEIRQLNIEIKTLFKKQHVPKFCNSRLYYSLFMTKGFGEVLTLLLTILIGLVAMPALVYFIVDMAVYSEKEMSNAIAIIIVAAVIIIMFALYFIIFNLTKLKHRDTLIEGRQIRDRIKANDKNIKAVRNAISKDKDETGYNLNKYDDKIDVLEKEAEDISKNKQDALTVFENDTTSVIVAEINNRRLEKVNKLKSEHKKKEVTIQQLEAQVSEMQLAITNQYEAFIGKDFCTADKLADLISLMHDGTASTVSEAMAAYKGQ